MVSEAMFINGKCAGVNEMYGFFWVLGHFS